MKPLNYTTTIAAAKTVGECQSILASAGAAAVAVHYDDGAPTGLSFVLRTPHGDRQFTLPVDVVAMATRLARAEQTGEIKRGAKGSLSTPEHAARVAWRVTKDWLEAQLALINAGMASLPQIMLPYLRVDGEATLWDAYRERERAALNGVAAIEERIHA